VRALGFQLLPQDFQPAIGQASGTVEKAHEIVKTHGIATDGAIKVKSERLGVFHPMPEVVPLSVFVTQNGNHLLGEIGPHTIAMETFFKNYEAELNIAHFPSVLAFRHFHLLREYMQPEDKLPPD
jgi:hypothetical protein